MVSLSEYFEEIESFEFGAQFSVYSGFRLVISDMDENETLQKLVHKLRSDIDRSRILYERIRFLLKNPPLGDQMAFDGSLTSYVYCLWKSDLETGYLASREVLNSPGLWWSAKLALVVRKEYVAEQISKSVHFTSVRGQSVPYELIRGAFAESQSSVYFSQNPEAFEISPSLLGVYTVEGGSRDCIAPVRVSFLSPSGRSDIPNALKLKHEFTIAVAS